MQARDYDIAVGISTQHGWSFALSLALDSAPYLYTRRRELVLVAQHFLRGSRPILGFPTTNLQGRLSPLLPHFSVYCCRFAPWHVATSATHPAYHSATMFIPVWYIPPRNIVWCGCRESNPERTTSLALRVCLVAPHPHNDGNGNRTRRMT